MTKLVRDLMHTGPYTCPPETRLGQVAARLVEHQVHALFVTDANDAISGIVTDFDLLAGEWLSADAESLAAMKAMTAGEMMTSPVATIEADEPAINAARRMGRDLVRRLLVTDQNKPIGVISISDFLPALLPHRIERGMVADVMSHTMLVCREETPLAGVARGLIATRYRSILVVSANGKPQGIISGLDFLDSFEAGHNGSRTAGQVMHKMMTISPTASLQEAANLMINNHHHRLVVVDPDQADSMPLGMLSSVDIMSQMAQPDSVWQ